MKHPKLGQHFLTRPEIAGWVADAVALDKESVVLEIGPGKGILTRELLKRAGKVVAVEKDSLLTQNLYEQFSNELSSGRLTLLGSDVRDFSSADLSILRPHYSLIANIPYYITGQIIRQFLTSEHQPKNIVLLVQKEVAERIVAGSGKESLLSLSVKAYGTPRIVRTVRAGSFSPPPKVDSAILAIENISRKNFADVREEKRFFTLLHAGFKSKRKLLAPQLIKNFVRADMFERCSINIKTRAEDLALSQWLCISKDWSQR